MLEAYGRTTSTDIPGFAAVVPKLELKPSRPTATAARNGRPFGRMAATARHESSGEIAHPGNTAFAAQSGLHG